MAEQSRKKKPFIRLELGCGGLLGLGVVIFCVFFWMFLLGIWAGQTVLQPDSGGAINSGAVKGLSTQKMISSWWSGARTAMTGVLKPKPKPPDFENGAETEHTPAVPQVAKEKAAAPPAKEAGPLVFTLQVASYKNESETRDAVLAWRASGYEAYIGQPDQEAGDGSWRVLIGKYTRLNDANAAAGKFEEQENIRAFISQLLESKFTSP